MRELGNVLHKKEKISIYYFEEVRFFEKKGQIFSFKY
jgi:hypothetical protein